MSSLHTITSEREIAAHITRMKALEESRQIPRIFILYLPPSTDSTRPSGRTLRDSDDDSHSGRITQTNSLSLVLTQLDAVLHTTMKSWCHLGKAPRRSRSLISRPIRPQGAGKPSRSSSSGPHTRKGRKEKAREGASSGGRHIRLAELSGKPPKAWFLDVASPTWEDLRTIGKVRRFLKFQVALTYAIAFAPTSPHFGRHSTTRSSRKAGLVPQTWILFYFFPSH